MSPISGNAGSLIVPSLLRAAISINNNIKKKKKKISMFPIILYFFDILYVILTIRCH